MSDFHKNIITMAIISALMFGAYVLNNSVQ